MSEGALPVATPATAVNAVPGMKVEYQPVKPASPHPGLSPKDRQFLKDHPDVWVHSEHYTLERQQRIIEGSRQLLAPQGVIGTCPVSGTACGRAGYGPHGIHSECVLLNYK